MSEYKSVKCRYCGAEMTYVFDDNPMYPHGFYCCTDCSSCAPNAETREKAYELATEFAPAADVKPVVKGEWGKPIWGSDWLCRSIIIGSKCSICHEISEFQTHFCPNCGADMRKEEENE